MKIRIKRYFDDRPLDIISKADLAYKFSYIEKPEFDSIIKQLSAQGTIRCCHGGRKPKYCSTKYGPAFRTDFNIQDDPIRIRLQMLALGGLYKYDSIKDIYNMFSEENMYNELAYNPDVLAHVINNLFREKKLKKLKSGCIKYVVGSIQTSAIRMDYSHLETLVDGKMTFGVEHEFISKISPQYISHILSDYGFTSTDEDSEIVDNDYEYWFCKTDGSIEIEDDFTYDVEITSPILRGKRGLCELVNYLKIIKTLKNLGVVTTNETAGIHVHHGNFSKDFDIKNLICNFIIAQPVMNTLFSYDRWDENAYNSQAKKHVYYHTNGKVNYRHSRTRTLNINPYKNIGTIEMRQCESTFSINKIITWVIIGQKMVKTSTRFDSTFKNLRHFFKSIKLNVKAQNALKMKWNKQPIVL